MSILRAPVQPDVPDALHDVLGHGGGHDGPAGLAGVGHDGLLTAHEVGKVVETRVVVQHQSGAREPGKGWQCH